jgi:hypothetical protein
MPDWAQYNSILAAMATIYPLTVTDFETKLEIPVMPFLLLGRKFVGSTVPPKIAYKQMLEFAALHGVKPIIEKFPMTLDGVKGSLLSWTKERCDTEESCMRKGLEQRVRTQESCCGSGLAVANTSVVELSGDCKNK